ncbi:MAG: hypothetical protein ACOC85_04515 [Thermoplasmatota archaeon]
MKRDPIGSKEVYKRFKNEKEKSNKNVKYIFRKEGYKNILIISYSSTVVSTIKDFKKVLVLESRPLMEGRKTARILSNKGVDVEYYIDAGMSKALEKADAVLVGADAVSREGFLNKIGTKPLFYTAKTFDIPFYVVCDLSKILPPSLPIITEEPHPSEEVWSMEPDSDIKAINQYFEMTPWDSAKLITELGLIKDINKKIKELKVSEKVLKSYPKA